MGGNPLVSCIMPTHNRRRFVAQAIAYFQRQDYHPRELIVLDDGDDPVADLVPEDSRVRYVRLDGRWPLGRKRNHACELSRGELICHWDDDDWMADRRLRLQVARLLETGADVCGAEELLHYRPKAGEAWLYRSLPGDRRWLAGGTLLYRRSAWEEHPFPDVHVGEDFAFVTRLAPERVHAMADGGLYVALLHERNTAAKNLRDARWQRRGLDEVSRLLAVDRDFYAALRNGGVRPRATARTRHAISVVAPFQVYDGYGSMSEYLVLGLRRAGAQVNPLPLAVDRRGLSDELVGLLEQRRPVHGGPVLFFSWPSAALRPFESEPELFINTMWESSALPASWPAALDRARAVIVPTRFVAGVVRESGVTAPVEVIPEGIDPALYRCVERPEREGVTALMVATVVARKHVLEGIAAWKRVFADDATARLIIKARFGYGNYRPDDPRIRFVDADEPTRGIAHWYHEADVLMALGNEGFGLPLVEGMATGLPVIALDSEGQSDACADARDLLLPVPPAHWEPCDDPPFGPAGVRGVPGVDDIADRLRWVAEHRDEARALGEAASAWATTHRDVWAKGPAVLATMEEQLRPRRSLRRAPVVWTPTLDTPCGVGEYTRDLAEALRRGGPIVATATAPDVRATRVVHVEHEPSLFDDLELARMAAAARAEGVPLVVTEHAVSPTAPPWEPQASALVSLSAAGAAALRGRSPATRVEHVPHGCHTWFPPRKPDRGRVVGAFGFLERHKGFHRLLDAARSLGDVELLMHCHAKRPADELEWEAMMAGLPVHWDRDYRALAEIGRRLAAQADILVFWYDDTVVLSASGAVCLGLATGVPVLASPTAWFDDVRDVTYQPPELEEGIARLLEDTALRDGLTAAARDYCHEHRWEVTARRHRELWESLERGAAP